MLASQLADQAQSLSWPHLPVHHEGNTNALVRQSTSGLVRPCRKSPGEWGNGRGIRRTDVDIALGEGDQSDQSGA
jgi:hypothetical protein